MGSKSSETTVGYWFNLLYHTGLTLGEIDAFLEFRGGDKTAWSGRLTASGIININQPNLWGGEKDQGGIVSDVHVMFGEATQVPDSYLVANLGNQVTAWRGLTTLAFLGGYYGANNPYPQSAAYKVEKILKGWDGSCWYPETAPIGIVPQKKLELYFALDVSTSMDTVTGNGFTRLQNMQAAINAALDFCNSVLIAQGAVVDLFLVAWSTDPGARETIERTAASSADIAAIQAWVSALTTQASTYFPAGLQDLGGFFSASSASIEQIVFFITDGVPFDNDGVLTATEIAEAAAELVRAQPGLKFYGINIDLDDTSYTQYVDTTPIDGVPVVQGDDPDAITGAMTGALGGCYAINPAHALYYLRTHSTKGREPTGNMNSASFTAAADQLYAEAFGICVTIDPAKESVVDVENRICKLIGGSMTRSMVDGQYYLDLARGDYVLEDLPILTDDDILSFQEMPASLDGAVNSVSVRYFDPQRKEAIITPAVEALGLIDEFGLNHQVVEYPEIPTAALATRIAERDLLAYITPKRVFDLTTTRKPYSWRPNTYFRLQSTKRGITDMVCIVGDKQAGTLRSGAIRMQAVEDIYALPEFGSVDVEVGVDTSPPQTPVAIDDQVAFEAPYVNIVTFLPRADLAVLPDDTGYLIAAAEDPANHRDFTLTVDAGAGYETKANGAWCPTATINEAAPLDGALQEDFTFSNGKRMDQVAVGDPALWGSEICRVDAIDVGAGTISLGRACADTVPQAHGAAEKVWFWTEGAAYDVTEYADGESVTVKLLSNTWSQQLPPAFATPINVTFDQRQIRPYPPASLQINAEPYPATVTSAIAATWAHRDRVLQANQLVDTLAADVGPEAGTTYTARLETDGGALVEEFTGITSTSQTFTPPASSGNYKVLVTAIRDGLASWQSATHSFAYDTGAAPTTGADIFASLVSWYDFENSLIDGVGPNDLSGTVTYSAGHIGQKISKASIVSDTSFAGISDLSSGAAGLSFGGWFYVNGTGDEDVIGLHTSSASGHYIAVRNSGTELYYVAVPVSGSATTINPASGPLSPGNWYFSVATFDPATSAMKLYLGDAQIASGSLVGTTKDPTKVVFGRESSGVYNALRNDATFVSNRVLTPEEITWLYNEGAGRSLNDLDPAIGTLVMRGAWTWFNDPRAIDLGTSVAVGGISNIGAVIVASASSPYTSWTLTTVHAGIGADDHNNAAYLKRISDGRVYAFYCAHNGTNYYRRISASGSSVASFGSATDMDAQLGGGNYAYANVFQLDGMTNDPILLFFREGTSPTWTMHYSVSTDNGGTWPTKTALLSGGRPYLRAAQNGTTRIDFAVTDGHPDAVATNSIRHFYYDNGTWYDSTGASIGAPPFDTTTDLTTVYDGSAVNAWVWDIQIDGSGNPVIVFATFPSTTDHRYQYAKWNGASWDVHEICAAGGYLYAAEPYYSGGICIDPDDVNVVYCAREIDGVHQLFRYTTADGGATWSDVQLTTGVAPSLRPFVMKGKNLLLFMHGRYSAYADFATWIRAFDIS